MSIRPDEGGATPITRWSSSCEPLDEASREGLGTRSNETDQYDQGSCRRIKGKSMRRSM